MKYLKLVKLMYLADREAFRRWGHPISTDHYVSMEHGPVVSQTYNLISNEPQPGVQSFWRQHIATVDNWDVELISDPSDDELSRAEEDLLQEIFKAHGHRNRWRIVDETHHFQEWIDPGKSSIPITYREILLAVAADGATVGDDLADLCSIAAAEEILHNA